MGTEKKPLRVLDKFFCGAQIAIPRSGVILYLQSLDGYANNDGLDYISLTNLFLFHECSGYSVPVEEESSQRTHRRKKKVNKGRWTKDEVRMSIANRHIYFTVSDTSV